MTGSFSQFALSRLRTRGPPTDHQSLPSKRWRSHACSQLTRVGRALLPSARVKALALCL